jgi:hypothetical protein
VLCARDHTPQDDSILSAAGRAALATPSRATTTHTTGHTTGHTTANTTGAY